MTSKRSTVNVNIKRVQDMVNELQSQFQNEKEDTSSKFAEMFELFRNVTAEMLELRRELADLRSERKEHENDGLREIELQARVNECVTQYEQLSFVVEREQLGERDDRGNCDQSKADQETELAKRIRQLVIKKKPTNSPGGSRSIRSTQVEPTTSIANTNHQDNPRTTPENLMPLESNGVRTGPSSSIKRPFKCPFKDCRATCATKENLEKHDQKCHSFRCVECSKGFKTIELRANHECDGHKLLQGCAHSIVIQKRCMQCGAEVETQAAHSGSKTLQTSVKGSCTVNDTSDPLLCQQSGFLPGPTIISSTHIE